MIDLRSYRKDLRGMDKEEFLSQLYTRREAEEYVNLERMAFQHHLKKGNIKPCKESGAGSAKVQLFWKSDLDKLKAGYIKKG